MSRRDLKKLLGAIPGVVYQFNVDRDGARRFFFLSDGIRTLFGYSPEEVYADAGLMDACAVGEDRRRLLDSIEKSARDNSPWSCDFRIRPRGAGVKWVRAKAIAEPELLPDGSSLWNGVIVDITEIKAVEERLVRLQALYGAMVEANRLLSRTQDTGALFDGVCRIAVEFGGIKMAWIGAPKDPGRRLEPAARYGEGVDYLDEVLVSARYDVPEGRGPAGTAYREGRTVVYNDFLGEPEDEPWREAASRRGFRSSASLPITERGRPLAVFTVYKGEVGAFDDDTVSLLERLCADISYALTELADEAERAKMERDLEESRERFHLFMDTLPAAAFILETDGSVAYSNRYVREVLGFEDCLGKTARDLLPGSFAERVVEEDARTARAGEVVAEGEFKTVDGEVRHFQSHRFRIPRGDRAPMIGGIAIDVTERKLLEEKIWRMAFFDSLTGLPNRRMLIDRLDRALARSARSRKYLAVMFVDLDHFKEVNDSLGHDAGDELLKAVAQRLKASVRDDDTVSRHGGDEFIVLLPEIAQPRDAAAVAEKIIASVASPVTVGGGSLRVSISVGIVVHDPDCAGDSSDLLKKADAAMYEVKGSGRAGYRVVVDSDL